jgi:hypothetical protein
MKSMRFMAAIISSGVILHIATVAYAQQGGMVVVDTGSIAKTIAKNIKVNVSEIPGRWRHLSSLLSPCARYRKIV